LYLFRENVKIQEEAPTAGIENSITQSVRTERPEEGKIGNYEWTMHAHRVENSDFEERLR